MTATKQNEFRTRRWPYSNTVIFIFKQTQVVTAHRQVSEIYKKVSCFISSTDSKAVYWRTFQVQPRMARDGMKVVEYKFHLHYN